MLDALLTAKLAEFEAAIVTTEADLTKSREALAAAENSDAAWQQSWDDLWYRVNRAVGQQPISSALEARLRSEYDRQRRRRSGDSSSAYLRQVVANLEWRLADLRDGRRQLGDALAGRVAPDPFGVGGGAVIIAPFSRVDAPAEVDFDPTVPGPPRRAPVAAQEDRQ
jgi:hypothetical protein